MASSLFSSSSGSSKSSLPMRPDEAMVRSITSDPRFQEFARANANKTPMQIAREYGLDQGYVSRMLGLR